jgi:Na+-transporting NADH:ubiquinone oxidoreductase subunit A
MQIRIGRGLDVPISGPPAGEVEPAPAVRAIGLLGSDYRGLKPTLLVEPGTRVRPGDAVFRDRNEPRLVVTAPAAGIVTAVHRGPHRELSSIVIELDDDERASHRIADVVALDAADRGAIETQLLATGLWTALRTRPFSRIPLPGTEPHAIFVTAIDTQPLAPDPAIAVGRHPDAFVHGQRILARLTEGPVYVCSAPAAQIPVADQERVVLAQFSGPHPAGLPGTHIHFLASVGGGRTVWHIGYQDVIAIGQLFATGELDSERVVALAGPGIARPRLVTTRLGAATDDLVRGATRGSDCRIISGSVLNGHRASGWSAYLGRYHSAVTVLAEGRERPFLAWLMPGRERFSATNAYASSLTGRRRYPLTTSCNGSPRAMIPIGSYERVMPLDILPTQLLRALVVGDVESAEALGCLELDEEDLALCSFVCPGKYDYGPALRAMLDRIEKEG